MTSGLARNEQPRYSSRKPIFDPVSTRRVPPETHRHNEELYRIVAKIRSLQDDVAALEEDNLRIEGDNRHLLKVINDLDYSATFQEAQLQRLAEEITLEAAEPDPILKYEAELRAASQKLELLHSEITQKHRRFEQLRAHRQELIRRQVDCEQQDSLLDFEERALNDKLQELLSQLPGEKPQGAAAGKVEAVVGYCRQIEVQISLASAELEESRRELLKQQAADKEKRIQVQYSVELLRERARDYDKKKDFYRNCYNQESIQAVIDDMLSKEDALRQEIALQSDKNTALEEDAQHALQQIATRVTRDKALLQEEIRTQNAQNELAAAKKQKAQADLRALELLILEIQDEGAAITRETRLADASNFKKITELQAENILLEAEYSELVHSLQALKAELS